MRRRVAPQALEPEQKATGPRVVASVPEEDVEPEQGPELPVVGDVEERAPSKLALGDVSGALEALGCEGDVGAGEKHAVGHIGRAGEDEQAQKADGDSDDGADDVHPPPGPKVLSRVSRHLEQEYHHLLEGRDIPSGQAIHPIQRG